MQSPQNNVLLALSLFMSLIMSGCDSGASKNAPSSTAQKPANETANTNTASTTDTSATGAPSAAAEKEVVLASGLRYTILKEGQGATPELDSAVLFHCTGWLPNGREFWDTRKTSVPQREILNHIQLIPGVVEALLSMRPGERRKLFLPSRLAYGNEGYPYVVPPRSDINMELELVSVER